MQKKITSIAEQYLSLTEPDGKDSEGQTMVYRIVHQKSPVQCANLMSSFLLVTEIHVFKVLPNPHTFALLGVTDLCLDQMGKTQKVGHGSTG